MTLVVLKEFVNIEKTLSDAAEDGCTSNTDLNALDQQILRATALSHVATCECTLIGTARKGQGSIVDNKILPINLLV